MNRLHGYDKKNEKGEKEHIWGILEKLPKFSKLVAEFGEEGFKPPIYNVWPFSEKTNEVSHFGNSEQRIVENLLYLYTEPFDLVVDPFYGPIPQFMLAAAFFTGAMVLLLIDAGRTAALWATQRGPARRRA